MARLKLKEDLLNFHLGSTSFFTSQTCCFATVVLDVRLTEQFRKDLTAAPKACSVRKNSSFSNLSSKGCKGLAASAPNVVTTTILAIDAMANFNYLPRELYEMILGFMPTRDLSALARTSRKIRILVEPSLYREIGWKSEDLKKRIHPPIDLLLRTIISRPELAPFVQCLALCYWKPSWACISELEPGCDNYKLDFTSQEMEQTALLIKSLHVPAERRWLTGLRCGKVDLFLALLITQLTALRRLYLPSNYHQLDSFFFGVFLECAIVRGLFQALESVEYNNEDEDGLNQFEKRFVDMGLEHVLPLFSITSLKYLRIAIPNHTISWPGGRAPISMLKTLVLNYCHASPEHLGQLLLATCALKSLIYDAWIDVDLRPNNKPSWVNSSELFDSSKLNLALLPLKKSLEQLHISIHFFSKHRRFIDNPFTHKFRGVVGKLTNLGEFTCLSNIVMPAVLLSDWTPEFEKFERVDRLPLRLTELLPIDSLVDIKLSDEVELYEVVQPRADTPIASISFPEDIWNGPVDPYGV